MWLKVLFQTTLPPLQQKLFESKKFSQTRKFLHLFSGFFAPSFSHKSSWVSSISTITRRSTWNRALSDYAWWKKSWFDEWKKFPRNIRRDKAEPKIVDRLLKLLQAGKEGKRIVTSLSRCRLHEQFHLVSSSKAGEEGLNWVGVNLPSLDKDGEWMTHPFVDANMWFLLSFCVVFPFTRFLFLISSRHRSRWVISHDLISFFPF